MLLSLPRLSRCRIRLDTNLYAPHFRHPTSPAPVCLAVTARWTWFPWTCLIDRELPALDLDILQPRNSSLRFAGVRHLDKPKATRPAGLPVRNEVHPANRTVRFKELPYVLWVR